MRFFTDLFMFAIFCSCSCCRYEEQRRHCRLYRRDLAQCNLRLLESIGELCQGKYEDCCLNHYGTAAGVIKVAVFGDAIFYFYYYYFFVE